MRANLPDKLWFVGKALPNRPDILIKEWTASGNDGHLFKGWSEAVRREVACKVVPRSNLLHGPNGEETWRAEVDKADALRNPTVVKFVDVQMWQDGRVDCVVLVSEFVEGMDLRRFVDKQRSEVTIPFITQWLATMLELFHEMQQRGLVHGDLHAGNVIVEDRSSYALMGSRFGFRVTDFGVKDASSDRRFKDDFHQLADILGQLLSAIDYIELNPRDKYSFQVLRDHFLARHLVEDDVTRDPLARRPRELFLRLQRLESEFEQSAPANTRLLTPFDFLSCEQMGDAPALLRALYSERFLGLTEIESRNNVVVTGPRGCGKSTVFKSLSLDQKLRTAEAAPDGLAYIGIYYRCDDLYYAFPRFAAPTRAEAVDVPLHFVTATLLGKLLSCVEAWAREYFPAEFAQRQSGVAQDLWGVLGLDAPCIPGTDTFRVVATELEKQRRRAVEWQRFSHDPKRPIGPCFGAETVQRTCDLLASAFPFLRERPVYFFIDDYSSPKITRPLQFNLNRLFMQRSGSCFFKLSTESPVSFAKSDIDGKIYVESREFVLHNLGIVYLHADLRPKLTFIEDVFRRRLAGTTSPFPARELVDLVGSNAAQSGNEDARQIRAGAKLEHWGKECLCKLCSGDIHYVISLVGEMVRLAGGPAALPVAGDVPRIAPHTQNRAIREAAGSFLRNLRGVPRHGDTLVAIVEAFGAVAHSYIKFRDAKNEEGSPPHQASRIEPFEPFELSEPAQKIYEELLRYSVFIEDFRGKSRRGKVVARLYLRRFLVPHFNLTFNTRDSIEVEPENFEKFLIQPNEFGDRFRLRTAADGVDGSRKLFNPHVEQLDLKLKEGGEERHAGKNS